MPSSTRPSITSHRAQAAARVKTGGRLVEEQHRRLGDQRGGEVEAPAHAARVRLDDALGGLVELEAVEQLLPARLGGRAPGAVQPTDHGQVLEAGQILVDGGVLPRQADLVAQRRGVVHDVIADDRGAPGVGFQQRGQNPDDRGLAGAVRAEQAEHRSPPHLEIDALQGSDLAVGLVEAADRRWRAVAVPRDRVTGRAAGFVWTPDSISPHSNESDSSARIGPRERPHRPPQRARSAAKAARIGRPATRIVHGSGSDQAAGDGVPARREP